MSLNDSQTSRYNSKIEKIISPEHMQVEGHVKEKVKEKLAEDAEYLIEKKRREEEKRERVRRLEDQYEKLRQSKIMAITERSTKSEIVREKQKQEHNQKIKRKSEHYKKVADKIQHHNEEQIEKAFSLQKQYDSKLQKTFPKTARDHLSLLNPGKTQPVKRNHENAQQLMTKIVNKTNKAQQLHQLQNKMMVERIKQKTKSIEEAQKRVANLSFQEQTQKFRHVYEKNYEIEIMNGKIKAQSEKKLMQKRKSVKQKLDKCNENLKHLSYLEQEKFQELQNKFNRKSKPKQWKDLRLQKYRQKWEENTKKLELQKQIRAQQILQKHHQISLQNQMYKQQKDKLIQAVKFSN